jgi:hypothetical protein
MNTTIQISDELRDILKIECINKHITYEELINDMFYVFNNAIPFKNEKQFRIWFEKNYKWLGYTKIVKSLVNNTPDYIMQRDDGTPEKVELEIIDKHFIQHKHKPEDADIIICVYGNNKNILGVPVLSLIKGYPKKNNKGALIQLDLTEKESKILEELKYDFRVNSKVEVIKRLIKGGEGGKKK